MRRFYKLMIHAGSFLCLYVGTVQAEIRRQWVDYAHGSAALRAYMVFDDAITGKRPAILMIHAREGMSETTQRHAETWTKLGYVVFAADIFGFGHGILPKTVPEMAAQTSIYTNNRDLSRARVAAAYEAMKIQPQIDPSKIAILGFCFGGDISTEFVASGAPLLANITIHGSFRDREPGWAKDVKSRFLVLHGAEDRGYPLPTVMKVIDELRSQKKDFLLEVYSGTEHGFSTPKNRDEEQAMAQVFATSARTLGEIFDH
jgi:dienelactone hydrolase